MPPRRPGAGVPVGSSCRASGARGACGKAHHRARGNPAPASTRSETEALSSPHGWTVRPWDVKRSPSVQPLWKTIWRFLKKLGIKPPCDPAIPLLGLDPEEAKTERDAGIPLLTAAPFTTAGTGKPPRRPLTDERMKSHGACTQWSITQPLKGTQLSQF